MIKSQLESVPQGHLNAIGYCSVAVMCESQWLCFIFDAEKAAFHMLISGVNRDYF